MINTTHHHQHVPAGTRGTGYVRHRARILVAAALVATALISTACSSGGSTSSAKASPKGSTSTTIVIRNFAFSPSSTTVSPGATITVDNEDQVAHTLTSSTGRFNTGDIQPGRSVTFTAPSAAGTYPYICSIHQYMTGTLIVS